MEGIDKLGPEVAGHLRRRLADLHAATCGNDIIAGNPQKTESGTMVINLSGGFRLIIAPNHVKKPINDSGEVNWIKVSRIKVLRIEKMEV
jgi:hypothetical protein